MLFSVAGFLSVPSALSQSVDSDEMRPARDAFRIGLFATLEERIDNVSHPVPGMLPECSLLTEGETRGVGAGILLERPILDAWNASFRVGLHHSSGTLRAIGDPFPIRSGEAESVVEGRVDEELQVSATGIDAELVGYRSIVEALEVGIGFGAWFRLLTDETHEEVAVEPADLLLVGNTRRAEVISGVLLDYNPVVPFASLHTRYDLPIGDESYLSPELSASYPLMNWTRNDTWRSWRIGIGASVRFGFPGAREMEDIQPPDTIPERPPTLLADVQTAPPIVSVQITEYDSTEALPMLNRIFFHEGETEIPERYHMLDVRETAGFSTTQLTGPTLEVYRDLLNVIGLRMGRLPDARLTITGYRNGNEPANGLDRERAEAVRDYLVNTWEIFPERIEIEAGDMPPDPAVERSKEGREENSMVEIVSNNPNVTLPVFREYVQRVATPPGITFYPRAIAESGVKSWELRIESSREGENSMWKSFEGTGTPPDSVVWDWTSNDGTLPTLPIELRYFMRVRDSAGQETETRPREIPVELVTLREKLENRRNDTLIESYSLLLFEYDSPEVSVADARLLRAIAGRVSPGARVRFTGYTDSLGVAERNRRLGTERAENAADIFREAAPNDISIVINKDGGENERYPYDTPEGRAYNRTVVIEVRTPTVRGEEKP